MMVAKLSMCIFLILNLRLIAYSNDLLCKINIKYINYTKNNMCYLSDGNNFYYVTDSIISDSDSICLFIYEPTLASFVFNYTNRLKTPTTIDIWLHEGEYNIEIDVKNKTSKFTNSKINEDFQKQVKIYDSIRIPENVIFENFRKEYKNLNKKQRDSLESVLQSYELKLRDVTYENLLKNTSSYLALDFIDFYTQALDLKTSKQKLMKLFNKLDPSLKKYKLYKICEEKLKTYKENPETARPIWDDK
jgi:hypothetical protein